MKNQNKFKLFGITLILAIGIILVGCSKDGGLGNHRDFDISGDGSDNLRSSDCEHDFFYLYNEPTCTEPGSGYYECNNCGEKSTSNGEYPKALGHRFIANWKQITSSGITEMSRICSRSGCAEKEIKPLDKYLESVNAIGSGVFAGNSALTEITIPRGVSLIGSNAFSGCVNLEKVTILGDVHSIGSNAFSGCVNLKKVTIHGSVTSINESAFSGCASLEEIVILASVRAIENNAFDGCSALSKITILSSDPPTLGDNVFRDTDSNLRILVPDGRVADYRTPGRWKTHANRIHSNKCSNTAVNVQCKQCK